MNMPQHGLLFQRKRARVMIIPMIDVMLFLLVFFVILTMQMIPKTGFTMRLPYSKAAAVTPVPHLVISLRANGDMSVNGAPLELKQLREKLGSYSDPGRVKVTVSGSKKASLQQIVSILGACKAAGIVNVSVAARR